MEYIDEINKILIPEEDRRLNKTVIDLFAGCGGLSLGFEAHGFKSIGYEKNKDACDTYNRNLKGICHNEELTTDTVYSVSCDVLIGGPPCQPFSAFGKKLGLKDSRDGFPIFISAVEKIKPKIFLFENVRGLLFKRNRWYLEQILEALENIGYITDYNLLKARYFDVPQNRERLFVAGYRNRRFEFPQKNNRIITAGEALGESAYQAPAGSKFLTKSMDRYIAKYEKASYCIKPRDLYLDKPARTLTCRNIAAPTSDMHRIKLADGRRRRLFPREAARLQSFPDWFHFEGKEESVFYQIGNAVPPMLSYHIAQSVKNYLDRPVRRTNVRILKRAKQLKMFN
ncbi:DNA cytosine methyltransferase [Desulfobacterales bacterium HSG2]|nr:DNA cytosine methyltransferase [Desulfobacterales bacterium HSG2]